MSVWIAETLIATTLLMALVMMVRRPVARWLGAGAAYLLWALPLARALLPALPDDVDPSPLHVAVDQAGLPSLLAVQPAAMATPVVDTAMPWLEIAITLWLMGIVAFLGVQAVGYVRFRRHMLRGATDLGQGGRVRIIASPNASGPLAFGVLHPFIVLPTDFALRYDPLEQDMAIAHERAHHERGDLAANMIALLLLAVHWCNPVAWIAYRAYRADQETACDARVLGLYGRDQAHAYGRAILKAAGGRQFAGACHLTRITALKGRLKMLSNHDMSLRRISWGMAAVALVTATGLALTASGSRAAQQMAAITDRVETADLARLSDLVVNPAAAARASETPAVPSAPARPAKPTTLEASAWPSVGAPAAPAAPIAPAADMIAPVPPAPPVVQSGKDGLTVTYADGRTETHPIPSAATIARMVPVVDVREGCEGDSDGTTRHEYIDGSGRRHVRVRICAAGAERQARLAERAADRAERQSAFAEAQAERQARLAERAAERAERQAELAGARAERAAQVGALDGLRAARAKIAANMAMPEYARAQALRGIDRSIANLRDESD